MLSTKNILPPINGYVSICYQPVRPSVLPNEDSTCSHNKGHVYESSRYQPANRSIHLNQKCIYSHVLSYSYFPALRIADPTPPLLFEGITALRSEKKIIASAPEQS